MSPHAHSTRRSGARRKVAQLSVFFGAVCTPLALALLGHALFREPFEYGGRTGDVVGPPEFMIEAGIAFFLWTTGFGLLASGVLHFFAGRRYLRDGKPDFLGVISALDAVFWLVVALMAAAIHLLVLIIALVVVYFHVRAALMFLTGGDDEPALFEADEQPA